MNCIQNQVRYSMQEILHKYKAVKATIFEINHYLKNTIYDIISRKSILFEKENIT